MLQTCRWCSLVLAGSLAALIVSAARPADAQPQAVQGTYVGLDALADVKRFSGDPAANVLDGQTLGGAVTLGTTVAARWDLEVGADVPRTTDALQLHSVTVQRSTFSLQSRTSNQTVSMRALVRFCTGRQGRMQIGYLAGLNFMHLRRRFDTLAAPSVPDALIPKPFELVDYGVAPIIGVDLQIPLARRLSVVPALHASAFNFHEVSGVLLRPRIGIRWTF